VRASVRAEFTQTHTHTHLQIGIDIDILCLTCASLVLSLSVAHALTHREHGFEDDGAAGRAVANVMEHYELLPIGMMHTG
jgi:hypothetical protein